MKLIVGLGNPGKKYAKTRHNIGFMFVDKVVDELKGKFTLDKEKKCEIYTHNDLNDKIIFIKPQTYMNLSGEAILKVVKYYQIPLEDILVIHDDLDLPTGKIRIRTNGSGGGHNGIKSIILHLKSPEFCRIRIGIDKNDNVIDYVLGDFSKEDKKKIDIVLNEASNMVRMFSLGQVSNMMETYNRKE